MDAEGWLHEGDLGSMDAQGSLQIRGRHRSYRVRRAAGAPLPGRACTSVRGSADDGGGVDRTFEHHDARHEPTLIATARSQMAASSPRGTFSQAELTADSR